MNSYSRRVRDLSQSRSIAISVALRRECEEAGAAPAIALLCHKRRAAVTTDFDFNPFITIAARSYEGILQAHHSLIFGVWRNRARRFG